MNNEIKKRQILDSLENKDMDALKQILNQTSEGDILTVMVELPLYDQAIVFRLLTKDKALLVFELLDTSSQKQLIQSFTEDKARELFEGLSPDDRVSLLDELPASVAKKMIFELSSAERQMTNLLLGYEAETAGRRMTPEFVTLSRNMKVSEALEKIKRQASEKETIYTLFITNETKVLEGITSLQKLVLADSNAKVESIMRETFAKVTTDTDQEEVAMLLKKRDLLAVPVVDKENRIVGIITVDDAMDILEDEATEDILNKAGLAKGRGEGNRSEAMIRGSMLAVWKVRLPFLMITLVGGLIAGMVIGVFEETLEAIIIAAMFIPVVMDMGGNVGIQSSTIFLRGALLGHVKQNGMKKLILRETLLGLSMGIVVGTVCGLVAFGFSAIGFMGEEIYLYQSALLGVSVGLSLVLVMTFSAFLGFIVPLVLMKFDIDQAAATDPIITGIKDITGLLIYFGLIALFLSQLLY
ncbi:MAG: magnesium transporter [Erysipelotrichales bacterium]|nr:magnesium transporter [Erysipelotrichales bacterium]